VTSSRLVASAAQVAAQIRDMALNAGADLTPGQIRKLSDYWALLASWNSVINLTGFRLSMSDPDTRALDRLIIEPLRALPLFPPGPLAWFDLGSGGGSPALPLKVVRQAAGLTMVESRSRKAAFLREAVRVMGLTSVTVLTQPVETVARHASEVADVVTIRAVRGGKTFTRAAADLLRPGGLILWFGRGPAQIPFPLLCAQIEVRPELRADVQVLRKHAFHVER